MKKFFTVISLQTTGQLFPFLYQAIGNTRLQMKAETRFPILTAMDGYTEQGEEIAIVAVVTDNEPSRHNLELFRQEVDALCSRKGLVCQGIQELFVTEDERISNRMTTFQKLIDLVADDDELFSCMTYGTKPLSQVVMLAVQYAYRIKRNTSISCIVYGEVKRPERDPQSWKGFVYDMTALVQMDEIIHILADRGVSNPKAAIDNLLSL